MRVNSISNLVRKFLRNVRSSKHFSFTRVHGEPGISPSRVFSTWLEALESCGSIGYASDIILERTINSTLQVLDGKKEYIRDSVAFDGIQYDYPVLFYISNLLYLNKKPLTVIDFGGALGSTFLMISKIYPDINCFDWNIVEQAQYVDAGRNLFGNIGSLSFWNSLSDLKNKQPSLVLFSSVLMYLEDPKQILQQAMMMFPQSSILIDRTILHSHPCATSSLSTQVVSKEIFGDEVSYPMWIFSKHDLLELFQEYEITEFPSNVDPSGLDYCFKGFYIQPRSSDLTS